MPVIVAALALVAAAVAVPALSGWNVHPRHGSHVALAPWHGWWEPHIGPGTIPALLIAVMATVWAVGLAARLSWRWLVLLSYAASLGWLLSLALVDGPSGLSRVLGNPHEYLQTARHVDAIGPLLASWVDHVPLHSNQHWPTHVAGHPPGMLLFFVGLDRLGLGGDLAAGVAVTAIAASIAPAVLITMRRVGAYEVARRAAPFLVFTPAAVYLAVSADAVMAAVAAWAMALLARGTSRRHSIVWAAASGLLFGVLALMSYGMVLFGVVALGLMAGKRAFRAIIPCGLAAAAVVLIPAHFGFWWPEGFVAVRSRYWEGIASDRPAAYWMWANLALLVATAGPVVAAGLTRVRRLGQPSLGVVLGAVWAVVIADVSQMSRGEVERIWLPFIPWLTIATATLPRRWFRLALASQLLLALALQHLLYTSW